MIIAEIKAGQQLYNIQFTNGESLEVAYEYAWKVAKGMEIHKGENEWLRITSGNLDHIRVYKSEPQDPYAVVEVGVAGPQQGVENPLRLEDKYLDYLGQRLYFQAVVYSAESTTFIMPYRVNNEPAYGMIKEKGMKDLVKEFGKQRGYVPVTPVLPHGPIYDENEAMAFVKDYAEETEAERETMLKDADKTARAIELKGE